MEIKAKSKMDIVTLNYRHTVKNLRRLQKISHIQTKMPSRVKIPAPIEFDYSLRFHCD